jgi:CubicO group peptidase (beta-lactamase class C family)
MPSLLRNRSAAATFVALLVLVAGCAREPGATPPVSTTPPEPPVEYPGRAWDAVAPADVGLDGATLDAVRADLEGSASDCVIVIKDGRIAYETTWNDVSPDKDQIVWSVSKSLTSLLVGIAAHDGRLNVDQPAADFVEEWRGTPAAAVTIRHLLSMTSGRHFDFETDFVVLPTQAEDQTAFSIGLAQDAPPGTVWQYSNSAVQVLDRVISVATGTPTIDYARQKLFDPVGVEATWLQDKAGHPWTYGGATMSCRDLARIGYLMLHEGRWREQQVVPEAWVHESTRPSQELRRNYGLLWWLNVPENPPPPGRADDVQSGDRVPGLADDAYFARGLNGQFITVIPDDDTVVIRTGDSPVDRARFGDEGKVLDALLTRVVQAEQTGRG